MAKRLDAPYRAGERTMLKIKHARSADCVVAGFRWHKNGVGTMVGSLLLGLYDESGTLHHVGVTASFTNAVRKALVAELAALRENALEGHPWRDWAEAQEEAEAAGQRRPGASSRWNRGKDLSWEALRPERVCEVAYDHMQGTRFRHARAVRTLASRTSARATAATTSWRSRPPTSWSACSARATDRSRDPALPRPDARSPERGAG